ncbi:MAG: acyltransferase [Acidobacteria bacterium]|nr:acyltransferase [Acidobacteriota bacterium]
MSEPTLIRGRHLPGLDGIRGLAVASVVMHHLSHRFFQGGYVGVDLFFVLSGFLITSLLAEEQRVTGAISLSAFYIRRIKRLFPALAGALVLTGLVIVIMGHWHPTIHAGTDLASTRRNMFAALFYFENWMSQSLQNPVTHMWSLSVEEQFYIAWPFIFICLSQRAPQIRFRWTAGLASVGLLLFPLSTMFADRPSTYGSTFSRGGQLLAGATLALALQSPRVRNILAGRLRWAAPPALLIFLAITQSAQTGGLVRWPPLWMFQVGFIAVTLSAMVLIATNVLAPESVVARIFRHPVLVRLGLISYGLYVYHWIVVYYLTVESTGLPWFVVDTLRIIVSLSVAAVSYRCVEMPLRRMQYSGWRRFAGPVGLTAVIATILVATTPRFGAPYDGPTPTTPMVAGSLPDRLVTTGSLDAVTDVHSLLIVGDVAMRRISLPLTAAFADQTDIRVVNAASSPWGVTATSGVPFTPEEQRTNINLTAFGAAIMRADLVIMSSTVGDFVTVRSDPRRYERALTRLVGLIVAQPQHPGVVLVLAPPVTIAGQRSDQQSTVQVNAIMRSLAKRWPQQVLALEPTVISRGATLAPIFGPPNNAPNAPTSQWVRWRAPDGLAICQPAAVRQAAAVLRLVEGKSRFDVATNYWRGAWTRSKVFLGPTRCISDHP